MSLGLGWMQSEGAKRVALIDDGLEVTTLNALALVPKAVVEVQVGLRNLPLGQGNRATLWGALLLRDPSGLS